MPCVICLDEEMPGDVTPCKTCFGIQFHESCLIDYRRTKNVCPTCKAPFEQVPNGSEEDSQPEQIAEHDHIVHRIQENTHAILTDAYRSAMFFQLLLIFVTIVFVPQEHKMSFASLLTTLLSLVWAHVFERADRLMVVFRLFAAMGWSLTSVNTIMYDRSMLMIAYVCLSCMNVFVYVVRHSMHTNIVSVHPE